MTILKLLRSNILSAQSSHNQTIHIHVQTHILPLLTKAAENPQLYDEGKSPETAWLQRLATDLASGTMSQLGFIVNCCWNHWFAVVMDFTYHHIWFGDSLGYSLYENQEKTLKWWGFIHTGQTFTVKEMPVTIQFMWNFCIWCSGSFFSQHFSNMCWSSCKSSSWALPAHHNTIVSSPHSQSIRLLLTTQ